MVGKKHLTSLSKCLGFILLLIISISLSGCSSQEQEIFSIGISQIVENPVLDLAREGFIDALKEKGYEDGKNIKIDTQFAQGDIALTTTIAQNFVSQKKDLIFAISTPSAQSAFQSTKEIPILFTAVTDPVSAGLMGNLDLPEGNITGTTDLVPIEKQLKLGKKIFPGSKKVGVPYNTSEVNSQVQVELAKEAAKLEDLEIVEIPVTNSSEIEPALRAKIDEVDFLFLPSDNLIASSMSIITKVALDNNIGAIGVDEPMVKNGALACEGLDYYKLGYETGLMAVDIINGKNIKEIPPSKPKDTQLTINQYIVNNLGVELPKDILDEAIIVEGEK
ncbi:putative ABC transport system substrate-binding protein [Keratinibaculum paraultunense]|uniref:Putative ABC transport system substrate-binding protein n=1 Tax=Keratinibaculum paraultunense TaxID=1278232 RepID=A0A4R3KSR0_9FIRM|nr:ABC transporter substrate-binding protein [Keratinibaculum paraultunense]QQY79605.1 ABC transporter substrate-binding protein [Keratinibaculum paraultunense]TCS87629.1 putative ABC transport system substrate-binding protein [Keratinibaculum paraultunense]